MAKRYTDDELILALQEKHKKLGRRPKMKDVKSDPDMASASTYAYRFDTWKNALKVAGIEFDNGYSKSELIELIQKKAKELGKSPAIREVNADPDLPSMTTFRNHFETWNNALKAAGLEVNHEFDYNDYSISEKKDKELTEGFKEVFMTALNSI